MRPLCREPPAQQVNYILSILFSPQIIPAFEEFYHSPFIFSSTSSLPKFSYVLYNRCGVVDAPFLRRVRPNNLYTDL